MAGKVVDEVGPGKGYVTPKGIIGVALYLILFTLGPIAGLVLLWPSCEVVNGTTNLTNVLTVTSISPSSGTIEGGDMVSILGTGFTDGVTANFGEVAATEVRIVDSTRLRARSPVHKKGVIDIVVSNPDKKKPCIDPWFSIYRFPGTSTETLYQFTHARFRFAHRRSVGDNHWNRVFKCYKGYLW